MLPSPSTDLDPARPSSSRSAEEMDCIYAFVKEKYEAVVEDVKWDLDEESPKFDDEFELELEGSPLTRSTTNGTIGHGGLKLAPEMITTEAHDERLDLVIKSLQVGGDFLEEALAFIAQKHRRDSQVDGKDDAEESRQTMLFAGDDASAPPIVWTLLWGGKYSNIFGENMPDELRRWGCVM